MLFVPIFHNYNSMAIFRKKVEKKNLTLTSECELHIAKCAVLEQSHHLVHPQTEHSFSLATVFVCNYAHLYIWVFLQHIHGGRTKYIDAHLSNSFFCINTSFYLFTHNGFRWDTYTTVSSVLGRKPQSSWGIFHTVTLHYD